MTIAVLAASRSPPPTATSSNSSVFGTRAGPGDCTTSVVTVSVTNGQGPFMISWTGSSGIAAINGTSFTTAFSGTVSSGETKEADVTGVVIDARNETSTVTVHVVLSDITS